MNRAERRRVEKQRAVRRLQKELTGQILQEVENDRVEALMTCFVLALHEEFGFGKERCLRALRRVDSYMEPYVSSQESVAELKARVKSEVGIVIEC